MQKVILPSGLEVIYYPIKGVSVTVQVMVKIGSGIEKRSERGIAHFLEHILFEGTTKRPTSFAIANEIEKVGGAFNAYTTDERTCYYAKVPRAHFLSALDVLSDIVQHPLFLKDCVEKEKKVVLKEIDMVHDDPHSLQWVVLQGKLYPRSSTLYPTYGNRKIISALTPTRVRTFFEKYYHPQNMILCIVGDVGNLLSVTKEIEKRFQVKKGLLAREEMCTLIPLTRNGSVQIKKDISSCHVALGFRAVNREHKDSYTLDVIDAILGRGQSGKMFQSVRGEHGLAYEVGTQYVCDRSYGYFAVFAVVDKAKREAALKVIVTELEKLQKISVHEVAEAKTSIEGEYLLDLEDTQKVADQILFWRQIQSVALMMGYLKHIRAVKVIDVKRVAKKYLQHYVKVSIAKKK